MTTEERLEKLEKKCRRLMIGGGSLVVILMGAMITGAAFQDEVKDEIKARKFTVVDKNGAVRIGLADSFIMMRGEDSGHLILSVGSGKASLSMGHGKNNVLLRVDEKTAGLEKKANRGVELAVFRLQTRMGRTSSGWV